MNIEATQGYIPTAEFAISENNPMTPAQFRWVFRQREYNGMSKAFVKVSKRNFLVHTPTFFKLLDTQRQA